MDGTPGWTADGPALLGEIATDNTAEFWAAHRDRYEAAVLAPMRALAAALEAEHGPVRVFRPQVNRRFRPDVAPYRTDTGGVARSAGGCPLGVVLSATALTVSAGYWIFDAGQLRRYRAAVDAAPGPELEGILADMPGFAIDETRRLRGAPRRCPADHPRIGLLRHRGLQVTKAWAVGDWLATDEPLHRVRDAWRAAGPLVGWLDTHVGAADAAPVPAQRARQ